jgi:hypothetical protein
VTRTQRKDDEEQGGPVVWGVQWVLREDRGSGGMKNPSHLITAH